jgi:acyl-coenzyme A thioesterase PaaI-like protein
VKCSLVDTIGSLALSSKGLWLTGVQALLARCLSLLKTHSSTDMSIQFLKGSKPGDTIRCEGVGSFDENKTIVLSHCSTSSALVEH